MISGTPLERVYRTLVNALLVRPLDRAGCTPDHLTVAGLALAAAAAVAAPWWPVVAGVLVLAGGVLDTLDGSLARATGKTTRAGAFLDSTLDRYGEFFVLLGLWGRASGAGLWASGGAWALLALQGSLMVSYARARAEGLGYPLRGGAFERPERLILAAAGLLATPWEEALGLGGGGMSVVTLAVIAVGANLTALGRIVRGRRALSLRDAPPGGGSPETPGG